MLAISPLIGMQFSVVDEDAITAAKIISFGELNYGWHYGEGGPIAPDVLKAALDIYWHLLSLHFKQTDAFPGVGGEVMVTAYEGRHYIEIIVEANCTVSLHQEIDNAEVYSAERLTVKDALIAIEKRAKEISLEDRWSTSGFFIRNISIPILTETVLQAWPFETLEVASPSSKDNALILRDVQSASMLESFTLTM